ncbi:hypothetical protein CKA32_000062 [Geitlerinema sp. FC II]|nr:hypothetical protein CKA32_000062 [Geitlerinema sp. FC II]
MLGDLSDIEVIAVNLSIRELRRLKEQFGGRRWRKLKGLGLVRFPNGDVYQAELHWYEAHGIGRRKMKVKTILD